MEGRRESQQPRAFQSPGEEILGGQRVGTGSDLRWNWGSGAQPLLGLMVVRGVLEGL